MKKGKQLFADLLYRCGANYKTYFSCPIPKKLKEGDEITIEELGFKQHDFFESIVKQSYNDEYDHNILEVIEVFKSKEECESDFYAPEDINGVNEPENQFVLDVHKFADVDASTLPKGFKEKLEGLEKYMDNVPQLSEHLYLNGLVEEANEQGVKFTKKELAFIKVLETELNKKDCAYFRIINP